MLQAAGPRNPTADTPPLILSTRRASARRAGGQTLQDSNSQTPETSGLSSREDQEGDYLSPNHPKLDNDRKALLFCGKLDETGGQDAHRSGTDAICPDC